MESKNRRKIKIIILAVAIVAIMSTAAVGVMAATGFFQSDKEKALKLLAQLPDKINQSYINDYLGTKELSKNVEENGSSFNAKISDIQINGRLKKELDVDLSGYALQMDMLANSHSSKVNAMFGLSKGDTRASAVIYTDEEKTCFAFPELSKSKYVTIKKEVSETQEDSEDAALAQNRLDYITSGKYKTLATDTISFLGEEIRKLYGDLICEETGRDEYSVTIPKDTLDTVMADTCSFMEKHKDFVELLDAQYDTDLLALLRSLAERMHQSSSDFIFHITANGESLSKITADVTVNGTPFSLVMNFQGKEDSKAEITLKTILNEEEVSLELVMKDGKTDVYTESVELHLLIGGISFGGFTYSVTIDPKDNRYNMEMRAKVLEDEIIKLSALGYVKNLIPGRSVSYELEQVSASLSGENIFSAAMEFSMGLLEGEAEPPEGEEIIVDPENVGEDPKYQEFMSELMNNGLNVLMEWGIMNQDGLSKLLKESV